MKLTGEVKTTASGYPKGPLGLLRAASCRFSPDYYGIPDLEGITLLFSVQGEVTKAAEEPGLAPKGLLPCGRPAEQRLLLSVLSPGEWRRLPGLVAWSASATSPSTTRIPGQHLCPCEPYNG